MRLSSSYGSDAARERETRDSPEISGVMRGRAGHGRDGIARPWARCGGTRRSSARRRARSRSRLACRRRLRDSICFRMSRLLPVPGVLASFPSWPAGVLHTRLDVFECSLNHAAFMCQGFVVSESFLCWCPAEHISSWLR